MMWFLVPRKKKEKIRSNTTLENLFNCSTPEAKYEAGRKIQNWTDNPESRNDEHTAKKQVKARKVGGIRNKQMRHSKKARAIQKIHERNVQSNK